MKNLKIFLFNQNWFHLGSLIESLNAEGQKYSSIDIYFLNHNLIVKPLDLHFSFPGSRYFNKRPELIMKQYLYKRFQNSKTNFSFHYPSVSKDIIINSFTDGIRDIKSLKLFSWNNTATGMAILSFLIMLSKDSEPNIFRNRKLVKNLSYTYFQIFNFLDSLSLKSLEDEFWVCNGRPFHDRTIVEYAKREGISVKFFEIGGEGSNQDRWILHKYSPHDRIKHQQVIKDQYRMVKPVKKDIKSWYESQKPGGVNTFSYNFANNEGLVNLENLFVYFSSSDDEVSAVSMDWDSWWGNQLRAVNFLIRYFEQRPKLNLIIRVHPNQNNKSKSDKARWNLLQSNSPNVRIYGYNSTINSYQLINESCGVLTFGSTIGTEVAYARKPGALMSKARWDLIIPHKYIKNEVDLDRWISKVLNSNSVIKSGVQKSYLGSLKWGHYMRTAGYPWQIVVRKKDFRGIHIGYLNGWPLKPNLLFIGASRLSRWLRLVVLERHFDLHKCRL